MVSQTLTVTLKDNDDESSGTLEVVVEADAGGITLKPKGYGDFSTENGHGAPIWIELYQGQLRIVCHDDINREDPTILSMEEARESNRA